MAAISAETLHILALALAAAAVAGMIYQLAAAILTRRFVRAPRPVPAARPPISVLKPEAGDEPGLADNLRALFGQDYPEFQIICAVPQPSDPALAVARKVATEFPKVAFAAVESAESVAAANRKVASLIAMLPLARHDLLVFADADVRADTGYLDDIAAALERPGIGLATGLYVARAEPGTWSRLEALAVNHGFVPSVLVARALGRGDGCFGATMALRRETLERAGGLGPLADLLADDWALGASVRRLGLRIEILARPIDMVMHQPDAAAMLAHELRWGRTIASLDRFGYIASAITQPVAISVLAVLAGGLEPRFLAVPAAAVIARLIAVRVEEAALGLARAPLGLLAFREFLSFTLFLCACFGRTVLWRGRRYRVRRDGSMKELGNS